MRFVFSPPADEAAGLLTLPFGVPLEQWEDERLVEIRQRGLSRHVVRFVAEGGELYALKALSERLARREYRLLRALAELNVPAVEVVGIVVDRGPDLDAILVTRFLEYSTTYRALFSRPRVGQPTDRLLDALVELLVRLHLSGFFWGDCSLSNTLFRYDAGTLGAYLVEHGAGPIRTLWTIILPMALPGLFTAGIFCFTACWTEFLFALTFNSSNNYRTIPVGHRRIRRGTSQVPHGTIFAASAGGRGADRQVPASSS